ncbi:hypothetical protein, partial [Ilumatobacter sp.]|uniref:hypothetical protein n=1 Tax=Ilumatobacter sp. TaxID=1967498 RepID=UPI003C62313C
MDPVAIPTIEEAASMSGADLDRALVDLETARRQLEASYIAVIDRADDTGRFHSDGHASVRGWIAALTNAEPIE